LRRSQQRSTRLLPAGTAPRKRLNTSRNSRWYGQLLAIDIHTRRTDTRTAAPILNTLNRIVSQRARATRVPARPTRRNAFTNTYASDENHSRI